MRLGIAFALATLWGCPKSTPATDAGQDAVVARDIPAVDVSTVWDGGPRFVGTRSDKLDLLVVTNELAMIRGPLRAGIPWIVQALLASDLDVRVGVIGADLGDPSGVVCELPGEGGGALLSCSDGAPGLFFDPSTMSRDDITSEMRCRVPLSSSTAGENECELVQPFSAMLSAMLPAAEAEGVTTPAAHGDGINEPFFRRDAFLAVLVLSVPDDCSLRDPELTTSDRYEGETARLKCIAYPEALHPADDVARRLSSVRAVDTFGVYSVSNMPAELSGLSPEVILADSRMSNGALIEESIAHAMNSGWDPDFPVHNRVRTRTASRRIVELGLSLREIGVHTGSFSYQLETGSTGVQAFEEAVAPVIDGILEGLRQPR